MALIGVWVGMKMSIEKVLLGGTQKKLIPTPLCHLVSYNTFTNILLTILCKVHDIIIKVGQNIFLFSFEYL